MRNVCVRVASGVSRSLAHSLSPPPIFPLLPANHVAAAPLARLVGDAARLQRRFDAIQQELDVIQSDLVGEAARHFPPSAQSPHPLATLNLHPLHLELLGEQTTSTMAQLAEAAFSALGVDRDHFGSSRRGQLVLPERAFFLEDVLIDPTRAPPSEALIDELRALRRESGEALVWENELRSVAARAPLAETKDIAAVRSLAQALRARADIQLEIDRGSLPRIVSVAAAIDLSERIEKLLAVMVEIDIEAARIRAVAVEIDIAQTTTTAEWIFQLLRHADNTRAQTAMHNCAVLAARLCELHSRRAMGHGTVVISIPPVLLQMVDKNASNFESETAATPPSSSSTYDVRLSGGAATADLDAQLCGGSEFAEEMRWQAHPERRGWIGRTFGRREPSQTLKAELASIRFDGRAVLTSVEWQCVEEQVVLRCCERMLREQWGYLSLIVPNGPVLPARQSDPMAMDRASSPSPSSSVEDMPKWLHSHTPLIQLAARAMECAVGIGDAAAAAHGKALDALIALSRGVDSGSAELRRLRGALRVHGKELDGASARRDALLRELDGGGSRSGSGGSGGGSAGGSGPPGGVASGSSSSSSGVRGGDSTASMSPVAMLRRATLNLGSLDITPDDAVLAWKQARTRLREARHSLTSIDTLRRRAKSELGVPQVRAATVFDLVLSASFSHYFFHFSSISQ